MNIMLVCAAGMSTSILMDKVIRYIDKNNLDIKIKAYPYQEFSEFIDDYDVVLIGPQIGYKLDEMKDLTDKPVAIINYTDYAIGNVENVLKQAENLLKKENKNV